MHNTLSAVVCKIESADLYSSTLADDPENELPDEDDCRSVPEASPCPELPREEP